MSLIKLQVASVATRTFTKDFWLFSSQVLKNKGYSPGGSLNFPHTTLSAM